MSNKSIEIITAEEHLSSISLLDLSDQESIFKLLIKIFSNILSNPNNRKYHDINVTKMCKKLNRLSQPKILDLLCDSGFCRSHAFVDRLLFDAKHLNKLQLINNYLIQYIKYKSNAKIDIHSTLQKQTKNQEKNQAKNQANNYQIQSQRNISHNQLNDNIKPLFLIKTNYTPSLKKDLIAFGYARKECHHTLPIEIIKLIGIWIDLCDKWDRKNSSSKVRISYKQHYVNNVYHSAECCKDSINRNWHHVFGTNIVQNGQKASWTLQITGTAKKRQIAQIVIGIIDTKSISPYLTRFVDIKSCGYGLSSKNYELLYKQAGSSYLSVHRKFLTDAHRCLSFMKNCVIKIELDMSNNKGKAILRYNGIIGWRNVDNNRGYRLCVAFVCKNTQIALVHST